MICYASYSEVLIISPYNTLPLDETVSCPKSYLAPLCILFSCLHLCCIVDVLDQSTYYLHANVKTLIAVTVVDNRDFLCLTLDTKQSIYTQSHSYYPGSYSNFIV